MTRSGRKKRMRQLLTDWRQRAISPLCQLQTAFLGLHEVEHVDGAIFHLATRTEQNAIDDPYGILRRSHRTRDGKQSAPTPIRNSAALWDFHCIADVSRDPQHCNRSAAFSDFCFTATNLINNKSSDGNRPINSIKALRSTDSLASWMS